MCSIGRSKPRDAQSWQAMCFFSSSRQSECLAIENELLWWLGIQQTSWKLTPLILFDWLRLGLGRGFPHVDFQKGGLTPTPPTESRMIHWIPREAGVWFNASGNHSTRRDTKHIWLARITGITHSVQFTKFNLHSSPFHPVSLTRLCHKGSSCIVFSGGWLPKSHPLRSSPLLRFVSLVAENSQNRSAESLRKLSAFI